MAAQAWRVRSGKSYSTASMHIAKNGNWLNNVASGAGLTCKMYERARRWFEANGIDFSQLEARNEPPSAYAEVADV